jgi:RHS repeat-associated protein
VHVRVGDFFHTLDGGADGSAFLVDNLGADVEIYTYDAYGAPTAVSTVSNPHMFTGREYDSETGLYYYRARMYNPTIGRFLQRDPIGYEDSVNLYQYVFNSPVVYIDPYGEFALPGAIIGATGGVISELGLQMAANIFEGNNAFSNLNYGDIAISATIGAAAGATGVGLLTQGGKAVRAFKKLNTISKNLEARQLASAVGKIRNKEKTAIEILKRDQALKDIFEAFKRGSIAPVVKGITKKLFFNNKDINYSK